MVQWREHQTWYNGGNTKDGTMEGTVRIDCVILRARDYSLIKGKVEYSACVATIA